MITYKQLTLAEIFEDCQNEIVPVSFVSHFHASTGRPRKHQLYPMLKALLIQRIFSSPTDTLLIVFLKYSQELRDFYGFDVVPDHTCFSFSAIMASCTAYAASSNAAASFRH